jgi:hypothetical protein
VKPPIREIAKSGFHVLGFRAMDALVDENPKLLILDPPKSSMLDQRPFSPHDRTTQIFPFANWDFAILAA